LIHLFNNDSEIPFTFGIGEKIAQLVIVPCWCGQPEEVEELDDTDRGEGKFGSTGLEQTVKELDERTKGQQIIGVIREAEVGKMRDFDVTEEEYRRCRGTGEVAERHKIPTGIPILDEQIEIQGGLSKGELGVVMVPPIKNKEDGNLDLTDEYWEGVSPVIRKNKEPTIDLFSSDIQQLRKSVERVHKEMCDMPPWKMVGFDERSKIELKPIDNTKWSPPKNGPACLCSMRESCEICMVGGLLDQWKKRK